MLSSLLVRAWAPDEIRPRDRSDWHSWPCRGRVLVKFRAELQQDGKTATGITVPPDVLDALGAGRRPAVAVTINGHTYRSTIGSMGGVAKIPVSSAVRAAADVAAGDMLGRKETISARRCTARMAPAR